jgi:arsenate reductase
LKVLRDTVGEFDSIDIVTAPPSADTLRDLHARSGLPLKRFFNVAGQSYRNGGFKDRMATLSEAEKFDALAADGKLIKRPILDTGAAVLVGFKEALWRDQLTG